MSASVFQAPGNRAENFIATVNASALPDPSTLNNGDYYIIQTGGTLWGKTWANGDRAISDGTVYSQDVDATKQVAEGGTGATTASGARTNLGVNGIDEDAESAGIKLVGPSLYFRGPGPNAFIQVAASPKFAFTDGINDLAFAIEGWVKADSVADTFLFALHESTSTKRQFGFYISATNKLRLELVDANGDACYHDTDSSLAAYNGKLIHIAAVYTGADAATFGTTAIDNVTLYINGVAQASTGFANAAYGGMSDTGAVGYIGRFSNTYGNQLVKGFRVYNRSLTANEVAQLARGNDLGFADEYADHTAQLVTDGDMETAGVANWTASSGTASKETASPHGGSQNLKFIQSVAGGYVKTAAAVVSAGKRYRSGFWYRTGGTAPTSYQFRIDGSSWQIVGTLAANASWTYVSFEFIANPDTVGKPAFFITGGDATTYIEIDDLVCHKIGIIADFRAENFDESTDKLYDESSNAFVGVNNGAILVGRALPVYKPGTFTPGLTFGGGNTGMVVSTSEGFLTRDGNLCHIEGMITLSAKGSSTGSAVITGLEFLGPNLSGNNIPVTFGRCANMANLTSPIIGNIVDNSNSIALQDVGAAGSVDLDETNFTDTTIITFSATYRIQ